ncbi:MAG TPA: AbrB/MazE/SpoVT family DNA-binding domain-containing protein [Casimicrobiaceae bacterium]|jgi:AbrB family looped-hinge helix DNA binding protein
MPVVHSKLTVQGQISVPAEVRRKLGLAPGSVLEWREQGGHYVVRRATRHTSEEIHRTLFAKPPQPKTLAELKAGIKRRVKRKHARG